MLLLACWWSAFGADDPPPTEPTDAESTDPVDGEPNVAPEEAPEPAEPPEPQAEPPEPQPEQAPNLMVGHFVEATTTMLAVAVNRVDVARSHAQRIVDTAGAPDPLVAAAREVADCKKVSCASEAVGRMGSTCADCHLTTGHGPVPHDMGAIPGKDARERHIYAATFAWVGLITPKQPTLLMGLSNVVPPVDRDTMSDKVGHAADAFRASLAEAVAAESLEDRAEAFGQVLEGCAACHEQTLETRERSRR
ncbi:MAG: hypothetical protein H6738_04850 [Alphaproteobacteria bacterium]|nr:hypothetical protein [Alphaproteobacteria bacterium]MCB9696100.1 hypothetical protein [Alphaproteobacteria bacterium]